MEKINSNFIPIKEETGKDIDKIHKINKSLKFCTSRSLSQTRWRLTSAFALDAYMHMHEVTQVYRAKFSLKFIYEISKGKKLSAHQKAL